MVADIKVDKVAEMVIDVELEMVANMEVDKVADMEVDKVADIEVDMVTSTLTSKSTGKSNLVSGLVNWAQTVSTYPKLSQLAHLLSFSGFCRFWSQLDWWVMEILVWGGS